MTNCRFCYRKPFRNNNAIYIWVECKCGARSPQYFIEQPTYSPEKLTKQAVSDWNEMMTATDR